MGLFKYTAPAYATRLLILVIDLGLVFMAIHLSSSLRHNFNWFDSYTFFATPVLLVLAVRAICSRWFRTYAVIVRYAGGSDVVQVFLATAAGSLLLFGLSVILRFYGYPISLSILFIEFFLTLTLLSGFRIAMPIAYRVLFQVNERKEKAVIIGAGQLGAMTLNVIRQDQNADFDIVGFIDDNTSIKNKFLDGVPIYAPKQIKEISEKQEVIKAIFAIERISTKRKNELVELCINNDIQVLQVPFQSKWRDGEFRTREIREIQIEDLLNREVISQLNEELNESYRDKTILVTGGAGSIGSEIVRQLIQFEPKLIIVVDQAESPLVNMILECKEELSYGRITEVIDDVRDAESMRRWFDRFRPDVVFHAAAYKHVPIMEVHPRQAVSVNVGGSKNIADLSHEYQVNKFIMVSTDKAVNPTNVMGASKRIAEIYIQSLNKLSDTQFITTRFGNVLGSNGSVVPRFKKQIAQGGPITVTHENITRYFMTIPEASLLVLEAGALGTGGEIFLFDMGEPVKIIELARKMISLSGLRPDIDVRIAISGLRPGEKLYEELLSTKENSLPTHHKKITRAKVRDVSYEEAKNQISALLDLLNEGSMKIVGQMKAIVPEFKSNNSVFKKLDEFNSKIHHN